MSTKYFMSENRVFENLFCIYMYMKLLIKQEELKNYKSRDQIPLECEICHKTFYSQKNNIQWAHKRKSINCLRVCSIKCRTTLNDKRKNIPCHLCKKITKHKQREIKNCKFLFVFVLF